MPMQSGEYIGGYRIVRTLGSGGMGTVYLANHPVLPRLNAVKVLSPELSADPDFRERFTREANIAAALDHPNIIDIHDRGETDGLLWIAMSYIDGSDAALELAKGPQVMTTGRALRIVTEVGKGLDYAHRRGLLHRDVKPANFLLSGPDPAEERVVLTDFGVARSAEDTQQLTQTGQFVATIAYASPEQLLGNPFDHRTDIYSLGCVLTKLLTGRDAYPSTTPAVVVMGHLNEQPPRPSVLRPGLPPAIDAVIAKALAKDPAARYNSCAELTMAAAQAFSTAPKPAAPAPQGFGTRAALTVAAAIVAVALVVGLVIVLSHQGGDGNSAASTATSTTEQASTTRTTTRTTRTTTSVATAPPSTVTSADCAAYQGIKSDVDARMDVAAPAHADRVTKYNGIAEQIESAAATTPDGEVLRLLTKSATAARALATRAAQPDATDDELEQLRLQFVDPWVALSFTCL